MSLQVFIVEDSRPVREIMLEQIEELPNVTCVGYADSEATAVHQLGRLACDVVIVDIKLKSGSGIGVLRALHGQGTVQKAARIVFSSDADCFPVRTCRPARGSALSRQGAGLSAPAVDFVGNGDALALIQAEGRVLAYRLLVEMSRCNARASVTAMTASERA